MARKAFGIERLKVLRSVKQYLARQRGEDIIDDPELLLRLRERQLNGGNLTERERYSLELLFPEQLAEYDLVIRNRRHLRTGRIISVCDLAQQNGQRHVTPRPRGAGRPAHRSASATRAGPDDDDDIPRLLAAFNAANADPEVRQLHALWVEAIQGERRAHQRYQQALRERLRVFRVLREWATP